MINPNDYHFDQKQPSSLKSHITDTYEFIKQHPEVLKRVLTKTFEQWLNENMKSFMNKYQNVIRCQSYAAHQDDVFPEHLEQFVDEDKLTDYIKDLLKVQGGLNYSHDYDYEFADEGFHLIQQGLQTLLLVSCNAFMDTIIDQQVDEE